MKMKRELSSQISFESLFTFIFKWDYLEDGIVNDSKEGEHGSYIQFVYIWFNKYGDHLAYICDEAMSKDKSSVMAK